MLLPCPSYTSPSSVVQFASARASAARLAQGLCVPRYAMKCLDKKRIKMKQGETLALNERIMLSLVSTGVSVPAPGCL